MRFAIEQTATTSTLNLRERGWRSHLISSSRHAAEARLPEHHNACSCWYATFIPPIAKKLPTFRGDLMGAAARACSAACLQGDFSKRPGFRNLHRNRSTSAISERRQTGCGHFRHCYSQTWFVNVPSTLLPETHAGPLACAL